MLYQKNDIDLAIIYLTESLLFSPLLWLADGSLILDLLFNLASSLHGRLRVSKEPEDAIYAAKYFRHLRDPTHTLFASRHQNVTAMLVDTLALQMELKLSDVEQTLVEMTALTQELLSSDPYSASTTRAILCLVTTANKLHQLSWLSPDLLNEIIECM